MDEDFSAAHRTLEADNIRLLDELEKLNDKYKRWTFCEPRYAESNLVVFNVVVFKNIARTSFG